jgi:hypothetical protein
MGTPFVIPRDGSRDEVIAKYRAWIVQQPALMAALPELRGKDLVCWCAPSPCHADVLLELANAPAAAQDAPSARPVADAGEAEITHRRGA